MFLVNPPELATSTVCVCGLRLVRDSRLVVTRPVPVELLVKTLTLDGLVITLTVIALKIPPPVMVIKTPLGLTTPLIPGTDRALNVSVVIVRVLLIRQILLIFVSPVVVKMVAETLLPRGGAITMIPPILVTPVGKVDTRTAEGHVV